MPIENILRDVSTIAIIGCSSKKYRTSHQIAKYLDNQGIEIIPINPNETSVLGYKSYDSMDDIPGDKTVDIVDIFRNKKHTKEMVEQIIKWIQKTGQTPAIWTQLDVSTKASKALAQEYDIPYIENRCIMVEHRKLH